MAEAVKKKPTPPAPWQPGQSGNPGGRPKDPLKKLARENCADAIETLASIVKGELQEFRTYDRKTNRVKLFKVSPTIDQRLVAIEMMLNRGMGKPAQPVVGGDEDDPPVQINKIERVIVEMRDGRRQERVIDHDPSETSRVSRVERVVNGSGSKHYVR